MRSQVGTGRTATKLEETEYVLQVPRSGRKGTELQAKNVAAADSGGRIAWGWVECIVWVPGDEGIH
jgi:hypothetical protein